MSEPIQFLCAFLAALAAGLINAVAGGGTLVSFPALVALGIPPVTANVTNTIALCPGYLGGVLAQRRELAGQARRLAAILPLSVLGGAAGGWLLIHSGERLFGAVVPYLLLGASLLLAGQVPLRTWAQAHLLKTGLAGAGGIAALLVLFLAAVYGGYFGAGLSVIVLAVLGLVYADALARLNALKQAIAFSVNITAAVYFAFSANVAWPLAIVMIAGAAAGGWAGGKLAGRFPPGVLRWMVVAIGVIVAARYFFK
jgi:uncharacterized membrane protein YfcA